MQKVFSVYSKNTECGGIRKTCVVMLKQKFSYISNITSTENKEYIKSIFLLQNDTFTYKWGISGEVNILSNTQYSKTLEMSK